MLYNAHSKQNEVDIAIKNENINIIIGVNFSEIGVSDIREDKSKSNVNLEEIISIGIVAININSSNIYDKANTIIIILKFL
jgi:hypothetical protein